MSVRDEAIKVIKDQGGMVVVNGVSYTLHGSDVSKRLEDLPKIEEFVIGDKEAEATALKDILQEKAELEARIAALTAKQEEPKAKEVKEVEEPVEDKKEKGK